MRIAHRILAGDLNDRSVCIASEKIILKEGQWDRELHTLEDTGNHYGNYCLIKTNGTEGLYM